MRRHSRGVTLLELILAIVVMSIAVVAVMTVFTVTTRGSVDPMIRMQAQLIAEAYLEEILLKRFIDPNTSTICPAQESTRLAYDNVCDYRAINQAPTDQFGNGITALSAYNVVVTVTRDGTVTLGTAPALVNGAMNTNRVMRVDVTVTGPNSTSVTLTGYRTNYNCDAAGNPGCVAL